MRPIELVTLSALGNIALYNLSKDLMFDKAIAYSISPSRSLPNDVLSLNVAALSFLPNL